MLKLIQKRTTYSVLLIAIMLCYFGEVKGQCNVGYERIYANSQQSSAVGVANQSNAVGSNLSDFSSISIPTVLGTRFQRLIFPQTVTSSAPIHVKLASTINLSVLAVTIEVQAYSSGSPVGTKVTLSSGALANLLAGENLSDIVINSPSTSYDAVQVSLTGGLLSSGKINIYAAYVNQPAVSNVNCNIVEDILTGSTSGLLSALNNVDDANYATDGNLLTSAEIRQNVGVAGYVHLTALYSSKSIAGDSVSITLSVPGSSLLDANVFTTLSVVTYLGNTVVETMPANSALLGIRLLDATNHIYRFTYAVNSPFDRISVQAGGLASAVSTVKVYEINRIIPKPALQIDAANVSSKSFCVGLNTTLSVSASQTCTDYKWYDAPSSGNLVFTGTSFPRNGLAVGTYNYYVEAVRQGCTSTISERSPVTIIVNALPTITLGSEPVVCQNSTSANLPYTATTGSPTTYSITWNSPSITAVTDAALPPTPITITLPSNLAPATYIGTIIVKNGNSCSSTSVNFNLTVNPLQSSPTITVN